MIEITPTLSLSGSEVKFTFIRAPGPGGQNVNKVASGVLLRFNVLQSHSLPEELRTRLVTLLGKKLTLTGDLIIKATRYRTQMRNKQDAIERLQAFIKKGLIRPKKRKKTRPTASSTERRLTKKKLHAKSKSLRGSDPKKEM